MNTLVEIGGGMLLLVVIVGGVLFYMISKQRERESSPPRLPGDRGPATPTIVELGPDQPLADQLKAHAAQAQARGLRPVFEVGAIWCPPSKLFGDALDHQHMQTALANVYLIRADMDAFGHDPLLRELNVVAVPVFFELDGEGRTTGRSITGAAWGADTVDNMSATMAKFLA
jgi:hypothetical protein